jgi:hypothetical protein
VGRQRLPVLAARFFDAATVTRGCAQRGKCITFYIAYGAAPTRLYKIRLCLCTLLSG